MDAGFVPVKITVSVEITVVAPETGLVAETVIVLTPEVPSAETCTYAVFAATASDEERAVPAASVAELSTAIGPGPLTVAETVAEPPSNG